MTIRHDTAAATGRGRTSGPRRLARATAMVACLPYIGLKAAWVAGSEVGIPEGSALLEHRTAMAVANGLSILMDAMVVVLALVLTRPWGMRLPAWLLAFPLWVATGLLTPIMTGYPLQLLVGALTGRSGGPSQDSDEPAFLAEWVFGVVYGGFILQGLALGTLFVLYARDRWAPLWQGQLDRIPASPGAAAQRAAAVAAAVLAAFPLTMHLLWACGVRAGLSAARAEERTVDFYTLEAVYVLLVLAMAVSGLLLTFRPGRVPVRVALGLGWVAAGAVTCWGAWMSLAGLVGGDESRRPTQLMNLTYSVHVISGVLVASVGAQLLAERAARPAPADSAG